MHHYLNGQYFVVLMVVVLFATIGFVSNHYFKPEVAHAQTLSSEEKAKLQSEYDQIQKEIEQWQKVLDDTRLKKNTLQGDVTTLNAQIKKAQAEISQRGNTISRLAGEINEKAARINTLEERLQNGKESLAKLMREKNSTENEPLVTLALTSQNLSDFFDNVDSIDSINRELQTRFAELREVKGETEKEKQALDDRKNQELDAKYEVEVKKKEIDQNKKEKNDLLAVTKTEESSYQTVLADRQRRAEEIRTALFGLRDSQGISFETALNYANIAQQKTGVRAAMTLAILSQESDLGKNVGSCLVKNLETGDGVGKNTGTPFQQVMKSPRDTVVFKAITDQLGKDWSMTPVSCPLGAVYSISRGYGGAMGPSQFIPSTWQLYVPRLAAALGVSLPNPWNAQDAVMATALYLADLGAGIGGYTAERNAACKYYSGRSCGVGGGPGNTTYGNSVVAKAQQFQQNIDFLKNL
ncbi:hypothetical protein KW798_01475 [Candidatus Parcubacteria bacterium]|nr:hypothetical protein [Candidatus Parcubacteria bacterium]